MKFLIISFIISVFLVSVWIFISLHLPEQDDPDKPSLITGKTCLNGKKLTYVAFRANKKSPWRFIYRRYEGKAPTKKERYLFALEAMWSFWFRNAPECSKEEWELMYDTIEKELSNK